MEHIESIQDFELETILITGGCGFIGTNLVKYLANRGYQIRILDNLSVGKEENLKKLQSQDSRFLTTELIVGDIRNWDLVTQTVKGMDAVVHLAAHTGVVESLENPKEAWDINVNGTLNLLEACRQNGVERFVFASSNAAVGEQTPPIDESKIPKPLSPYGASKLAGEALCSAYYHSFGLKIISLRFANCYGPYSEHKSSVISSFMKWAKEGKPLIIYGDGNQTRDFISVDDVCQAIHLVLTMTLPTQQAGGTADLWGDILQIGAGIETSINQLAESVKEIIANFQLKTGNSELLIIHEPERVGEIKRSYSDISKAKRILKSEPQIDLKKGLYDLCQWYLVK